MDRLEEIEAELKALEEARRVLNAERNRLLDERAGVTEGDTVVDRKGRRGTVVSVDHSFGARKPWVRARLFKKNGTLGQNVACFYSEWEKEA